MTGKILVVDDDAANRELLEELLRNNSFDVVTARDGREAIDTFAERQPDLVLLDAVMPGLDGFEVCRELKSRPESRLTPVVLVTGLSDVEDRVRGIEADADDFLHKPVDPGELLARVRSLLRLKHYTDELERAEIVLMALARSIEAKDPYTEGHCERLSKLAVDLGRRLRLPADELEALRRGGTVHDIGKVAVPDCILLKPGPLTTQEWKIMREHPVIGERICAPLRSFRLVLPIIRHHHERMDGSGYPDGLKGDAVPLTARVLQVVDIYDALTTQRPYKLAFPPKMALNTMEEEVRRGWWDPNVFAEFRELVVTRKETNLVSQP
jgi:putative two-component system response regulator